VTAGGPVYVEVAGERWRVHDCSYAAGRMRRLPLASPHATYRVFVSASGWRKAYRFPPREPRTLDTDRLPGQLSAARFIAPFPADYTAPDWRAADRGPAAS
jgi:hypothetical protein